MKWFKGITNLNTWSLLPVTSFHILVLCEDLDEALYSFVRKLRINYAAPLLLKLMWTREYIGIRQLSEQTSITYTGPPCPSKSSYTVYSQS